MSNDILTFLSDQQIDEIESYISGFESTTEDMSNLIYTVRILKKALNLSYRERFAGVVPNSQFNSFVDTAVDSLINRAKTLDEQGEAPGIGDA